MNTEDFDDYPLVTPEAMYATIELFAGCIIGCAAWGVVILLALGVL